MEQQQRLELQKVTFALQRIAKIADSSFIGASDRKRALQWISEICKGALNSK